VNLLPKSSLFLTEQDPLTFLIGKEVRDQEDQEILGVFLVPHISLLSHHFQYSPSYSFTQHLKSLTNQAAFPKNPLFYTTKDNSQSPTNQPLPFPLVKSHFQARFLLELPWRWIVSQKS